MDFVTQEDADQLLAAIDNSPWDTSLRRRTQHYGARFNYASKACADELVPMPAWVQPLLHRLSESKLLPWRAPPNQLTINEYPPGVGIASHVDTHSAFEDGIAALTLGGGTTLKMCRLEPSQEVVG